MKHHRFYSRHRIGTFLDVHQQLSKTTWSLTLCEREKQNCSKHLIGAGNKESFQNG